MTKQPPPYETALPFKNLVICQKILQLKILTAKQYTSKRSAHDIICVFLPCSKTNNSPASSAQSLPLHTSSGKTEIHENVMRMSKLFFGKCARAYRNLVSQRFRR